MVAPDGRIFILDFNGAELQASAERLTEEQDRMAGFLSKQVHAPLDMTMVSLFS